MTKCLHKIRVSMANVYIFSKYECIDNAKVVPQSSEIIW